MAQTEERTRARRSGRRGRFLIVVLTALVLLFGVPWWTVVFGPDWPIPVLVVGTVAFACAAIAFPVLMYLGHGRRRTDWAARIGDTLLGVIWVLFAWSLIGTLARGVLAVFGIGDHGRTVALGVLAVAAVLVVWGWFEAMRVPRIRTVQVRIPRLGPGLDGTRVVVLADTHFGPIDRTRWSTALAAAVNQLSPDIVCHAGDIADGTVASRRSQAAPLRTITAPLGKVFVTGNHEYFGETAAWLDHLTELGWQPLHNRHIALERGGDRLILAGIDDATAKASGLPGHGADLPAALAGADPDLPVLLVAHQPRQVTAAVAAGVDLQVSGHTHGGQIWPFHYLVRADQPSVSGLTRHGERTQLYTSRGAGFWGPPLRIFAPSEISLLILRTAHR
ncbi:MAG TPA: metallophosphoesterase [Actinophytocola sp.]|uniref:metallophosphoesterase n=1 Tax=Actinophytocola sp. TaxID=1872138 RepID=UPI002DBDDB89|nr:metallophosphoesterase [Actinophytocola sp.]HEU5473617.1 metallophosphoesterase [Actinophytocola sp.]